MKLRVLIIAVLSATALTGAWKVSAQRRDLADLRAEQKRLLTQNEPAPANETVAATSASTDVTTSSELLRLRSEVTRLSAQLRDLQSVRGENQRLQKQIADRKTDPAAQVKLPTGYIRKSQALNAGYKTPEDTVQTFLWAARNRSMGALSASATPTLREKIQNDAAFGKGFFDWSTAIPGMAIINRRQSEDGFLELEMEIAPNMPHGRIELQQVSGEWKIHDFH